MSGVSVPEHIDLMYPTLVAIAQLGGSAKNGQLEENVPRIADITYEQMTVTYRAGIKVFYNMGWARTYLKKAGAIDNPARGVWSLTPEGYEYLKMNPVDAVRRLRQKEIEISREWWKYKTRGTGKDSRA